uniref:CSON004813 protein n=1 Tax=Culicoides sonorensis TaxID=179676 RepID=A0A336L6Z9_CULSO
MPRTDTLDKGLTGIKNRSPFPNHMVLTDGVTFEVRYIGCVTVKKSMKQLDFKTRSAVAKECINRVCEAASLKSVKKRKVDVNVLQCIEDKPNMKNAGTNISLTVSSSCLTLVNADKRELIAKHDMPKISFASGGDTDSMDFVAYVAKDDRDWRACFVLECGGGQAQDLISTIGQAFELRYNEFLNKPLISFPDQEYYNDMPGKSPPEAEVFAEANTKPLTIKPPRERIGSHNLIDLNSPTLDHEYVNDSGNTRDVNSNNQAAGLVRDVFDLQPSPLSAEIHKAQLRDEPWYHGAISRLESEILLKNDGDFLVRDSHGSAGQYVLSGMQQTTPKHLLLIDPEGIVRTKDRIFESISDLITYHYRNLLPIISAESALLLKKPIHKK